MEFTPKSYTTSSPYPLMLRHTRTMNPVTYPTPPQSRAQNEIMSAHSPNVSGLGIMNCSIQSPTSQIAICAPAQSMLQSSQTWQHSINAYSNPSPNLGAFAPVPLYEDLDTITSSASSPYLLGVSQPHSATPIDFMSAPDQRRAGSALLHQQRFSPTYDNNLAYRSVPATRQQTRAKASLDKQWSEILKKEIEQAEQAIYEPQQAVACSMPEQLTRHAADMLLELDQNVGRLGTYNREPRAHPRSSQANTVATEGSSSTSVIRAGGTRKQPRRRTNQAVGKYVCEKCDKRFTRNSNCKSHMKTHDPNRKFPHKCTFEGCAKKFSRKTDLVRHVDSVHKKLRKFRCDQCPRAFTRQDTLRRHCEDGCRKQLQQTPLAAANAPVQNDQIEPYSSPLVEYRDTASSYRVPNEQHHPQQQQQQQQFHPFRQSFFDASANAFPHFP
ncbi:hypothetical protein AJ80_06250 [Polytolypa hystricis UAMH7299]|uniref:C2H2-type domain-containing protein n=1 Tax=Polytolypa hystricis (strain UAMH7299) TaxID=1447883 RepID=A0A2B7XYH1_POLH7|nr:hypothetical protein AJ80_06250 [Polytolypa hystricis UAMH7299]